MPSTANPLAHLLDSQSCILLDGGLATTLEADGYDLDHRLWSARVLLEDPSAIVAVHRRFLEAGADCIVTATYQASAWGFREYGVPQESVTSKLQEASQLAVKARDEFWQSGAPRACRQRPLVAASIGPYGAYLADGSEYSGNYGVTDQHLREVPRTPLAGLCRRKHRLDGM